MADGLALLGADLLRQAQATPDRDLLDQAVVTLQETVRATPDDDADLAGRLSNLGLAYRIRADSYGGDDDLDRAVTTGAKSVSVCSNGAFEQTGCLANFADSLQELADFWTGCGARSTTPTSWRRGPCGSTEAASG